MRLVPGPLPVPGTTFFLGHIPMQWIVVAIPIGGGADGEGARSLPCLQLAPIDVRSHNGAFQVSRTRQHDDRAFGTDMGAEAAPVAEVSIDHDMPVCYRDGVIPPVTTGGYTAAAGRAPFRESHGGETVDTAGEGCMRSDAGKGAALERRNARKVLVCEISIASGTMVFVTAPAQPSRNACRICSPEAVGGPEASRNGFLSVSGPTVVSRERSGVGIWSFLEDAWLGKSVALYNLRRYQDALQSVDRALELDPEYATAWWMKGMILSSLGKPDEADRCYARAQEINPRLTRV